MLLKKPAYTALQLRQAIEDAEARFVPPDPAAASEGVMLRPDEVKVRPELFQPREFLFGYRDVDPEHVKKLERNIGIRGELNPILVIKIGDDWVCVDGHHRLAAYGRRKRKKPIQCEWFAGSVREAVDESMRRNNEDKLAVTAADRLEAAWKRVLLDMGSKQQIATTCSVGTSTVAKMRQVKKRYEEDEEFAEVFAKYAGKRGEAGLLTTSWTTVRLMLQNAEPEEADLETRAERLARMLYGRTSDVLVRDARVTARALEKLNAHLPKRLMEVWSGREPAPQVPRAPLTDNQLRLSRDALMARVANIDAQLERREAKRQELEVRKRAQEAFEAGTNDAGAFDL